MFKWKRRVRYWLGNIFVMFGVFLGLCGLLVGLMVGISFLIGESVWAFLLATVLVVLTVGFAWWVLRRR